MFSVEGLLFCFELEGVLNVSVGNSIIGYNANCGLLFTTWYDIFFNKVCTCRLGCYSFCPKLAEFRTFSYFSSSGLLSWHRTSCVRPTMLISASINFAAVQFFRSYNLFFTVIPLLLCSTTTFHLCVWVFFCVFILTKFGTLVFMK